MFFNTLYNIYLMHFLFYFFFYEIYLWIICGKFIMSKHSSCILIYIYIYIYIYIIFTLLITYVSDWCINNEKKRKSIHIASYGMLFIKVY